MELLIKIMETHVIAYPKQGVKNSLTIDNLLTFNKTIARHSIDALLGTSWMREYYRYMTNSTINDLGGTDITGFQNEDGKISAGDSNAALLSFFARVNYDYDNKYLLSLSVRRDSLLSSTKIIE